MRTSRNSWKKVRKKKMRVGSVEDPPPDFAPALLALPGPHLLQAAGVQLGFVDDLDGDLEVEGTGERSKHCRPELGKVPRLGSSWDVLPSPPSQKACNLGHSQCVGNLDLRTFACAVPTVSRATLTSIGKYPLLRSGD